MNNRKKVSAYGIAALLLFPALTAYYYYLHRYAVISSDSTTLILPARDFLEGNLLLRGWVFGTNNFLFTDLIYFIACCAAGLDAIVMTKLIPALVMAGFMVLCLGLFVYRDEYVPEGKPAPASILLVSFLFFLVTPSSTGLYTLLNANSHNAVYAYLILCMMAVLTYLRSDGRQKVLPVLYLLITTLSAFSDSVTLMSILAPICAFCLFDGIRVIRNAGADLKGEAGTANRTDTGRKARIAAVRPQIVIVLASMLAFVLSRLLLHGIARVGGFETRGMPLHLTAPSDLVDRAKDWSKTFFQFYNMATPKMIGLTSQVGLRHLIGVSLMLGIVLSTAWNLLRMYKVSRCRMILSWVVVLNIAGCVFTGVVMTIRYIAPTYLLGTTLLLLTLRDGLGWLSGVKKKRIAALVLSVVICMASCLIIKDRLDDILVMDLWGENQKALLSYLQEHHLESGYGEFWSASSVAAYDDFETDILPVFLFNAYRSDDERNGKQLLEPYNELVKKEWYESPQERHFLVLQPSVNFDYGYVVQVIGEPDEVFEQALYQVWIYDKNLTPYVGDYVEEEP